MPKYKAVLFDLYNTIVTDRPAAEVQAMLQRLHGAGVLLGFVTSVSLESAHKLLQKYGLLFDHFLVQQGSDQSEFHKPDPRVFTPALEKLAINGVTDGIVYVGDSLGDFAAAHGAGLDFVAVTSGFGSEEEFRKAGATKIVSHVTAAELL